MMTVEKSEESVIVRPEGKITAVNAEEIRHGLLDLVQEGAKQLVIDLEKVDIIDSKGLAVFIVCHKTISAQGGQLTVVTSNPDLAGLFQVMRLDQHFTVKFQA